MEKNNRLQYWLFYGFIFTILPIFFACWSIKGAALNNNTTWFESFHVAIAKGELLLVSVSLLGTNFGDLLKANMIKPSIRGPFLFASVILLLWSSYTFSVINTTNTIAPDFAFDTSKYIFSGSVVICLLSIWAQKD
jgi:uncharacterized membrane-anchored protein